MVITSIIITFLYFFLIGLFALGFDKIPNFQLENQASKTRFSVIIPFRNEAEHLPGLLNSIEKLNYPKPFFEIIFVDDDSNDGSKNIIIQHQAYQKKDIKIISNIRKTHAPKKDAITCAINKAKYDWIITTDADCIVPKYWLDSFNAYIIKMDVKCIAAPVTFHNYNNFLNRFQLLDLLSLQGATIGGFGIKKPFLCNGANFGYEKSLFKALNGFDGNTTIASGDDIFLLEKASKKHPKQLHYLKCKDAIVTTQTQPNWSGLLSQRIRWAAKTSAYNNWFGKTTGGIVLLVNALFIILCILTLIQAFNVNTLLYFVLAKLIIDFYLIYKSATFFNQRNVLKSFFLAFLIYPFFSVFVAFISVFKGYKWKGRTFKK